MRIYDDELVRQWLDKQGQSVRQFYENNPKRRPKNYKSNADALKAVTTAKQVKLKQVLIETNKKKLDVASCVEALIHTVAFTVVTSEDGSNDSLVIYNYDKRMYEYGTSLLNTYIVEMLGASSDTVIKSVMMTLLGKKRYLPLYNPLPVYKIAVGNGVYNCLTGELEPFTPEITVLTRINTNYIPNAEPPSYVDGFTFDKMMRDFANHDENRIRLIRQISKSIITGRNVTHGFFVILGNGGDGKSTYFQSHINLIGRGNVGFVNFSEMTNPEKMLETLNKKLVIGLDNDVNTYIKRTATLKSMASHETITYTRKYLPAISDEFRATFVQLCNAMPRFAETGGSMQRRLITFKAENSYYAKGTQNPNVEQYITDKAFLEYMLKVILEDVYFSDYNDVDRNVSMQTLENEDTLGQFMDEMVTSDVISPLNTKIPLHYLFGLYRDWMDAFNETGAKLGIKGFIQKVPDYLERLGYRVSDSKDRMRPHSIEKERAFMRESMGHLANGRHVSKAIENNAQFRYAYLDNTIEIQEREVRRNDREISAIEYFGLTSELDRFIAEQKIKRNDVIQTVEVKTKDNAQVEHTIELPDIRGLTTVRQIDAYIENHPLLPSKKKRKKQKVKHYPSLESLIIHLNQISDRYNLLELKGILMEDDISVDLVMEGIDLFKEYLNGLTDG